MRSKILITLSAVFMAIGLITAFTSGANAHTGVTRTAKATEQHYKIVGVAAPAIVGSGSQYYYGGPSVFAYINAWNGGPWVKVYEGTAVNNDFTVIQDNRTGYQMIKRTNGTGGNACIGDANNDSGDARASLDSCGSPPGTGNGWGTDFLIATGSPCPAGQTWFQNVHWSGVDAAFLGPPNGWSNGSNWYLNKPLSPYCFKHVGAA